MVNPALQEEGTSLVSGGNPSSAGFTIKTLYEVDILLD